MSTNPNDYPALTGLVTVPSGVAIRTNLTGPYLTSVVNAFDAQGGLLSQGIPLSSTTIVIVGYYGTDPSGFNPDGERGYSGSLSNVTTSALNGNLTRTSGVEQGNRVCNLT